MACRQTRFCCGLLVLLAAHLGAQELPQYPAPAPTTPAAAAQDPGQLQSSPAPARPPGKAPQPQNVLKPVEIRANLESDTRRLSTAAKIIIGREEIERYGDSSMGELLKRLPVTAPPTPIAKYSPPLLVDQRPAALESD